MSDLPIARVGDQHSCPAHGLNPIVTGSANLQLDHRPVARVGDTTACGAVITTGAPSVFGTNETIAHIGSQTDHGGVITTGSSSASTAGGAGSSRVQNQDFSLSSAG